MILICGPCVIEEEFIFDNADEIINIIKGLHHVDFYFKASCEKDNRSTLSNYAGPGFDDGIRMLKEIKAKHGVKITTDFHTVDQIDKYGQDVDLIQIPAFLGMQTRLVTAAARLQKPMNLKKPQFLSPMNIFKMYHKVSEFNNGAPIFVTDRGTSFGYNDVIMDPRHVILMKKTIGVKVLADITHPQNHSKMYDRSYAQSLGMAYIAAGADGVFIESHINPLKSKCDGDCQILTMRLKNLLVKLTGLYRYVSQP